MKTEASESFVAPGLTYASRLIFGSEFFFFFLLSPSLHYRVSLLSSA